MSKESEAYWNKTTANVDLEYAETAQCVKMFKKVNGKIESKWVPLRETFDMIWNGWHIYLCITDADRDEWHYKDCY